MQKRLKLPTVLSRALATLLITSGPLFLALADVDPAESIRIICAVGPEGNGNVEASRAMQTLVKMDASHLPALLGSMQGANDLAANWLRSAIETIASRELDAGRNLPLVELGQFLLDTSHSPRARRLAFELIARVDRSLGDRLLTAMINDPSPELRRDGVEKLLVQANQFMTSSNRPGATLLFQQSLSFAREVDQIDLIARNLRALGQNLDLAQTLGFVTQWKVIGPFDSTGGKGFGAVYPPEEKIDLTAEYDGKLGKTHWQDLATVDEYGNLNMNKPFTPLKGVAAYAVTDFVAEHAQPVELRLGSQNSFKVWLNGKFLHGQDEYHRNKAIDQYRMPGQLRAGRNVILVKVCQNEQTEDWASDWDFQLRVCDPLGTPLRTASLKAAASATETRATQ